MIHKIIRRRKVAEKSQKVAESRRKVAENYNLKK